MVEEQRAEMTCWPAVKVRHAKSQRPTSSVLNVRPEEHPSQAKRAFVAWLDLSTLRVATCAVVLIMFCAPANAQSPLDHVQKYVDEAASAANPSIADGRAAFEEFRKAVISAAKRDKNFLIAEDISHLRAGSEVPDTLRPLAARLLRVYFIQRYGDRLGKDLRTMLAFRTVAEDGKENWQLPEFVKQREWIAQKSAELGLEFKSYDGRVEEITLQGDGPIIAILTHGDVVGVEGQEWSSPPWEGRIIDDRVIGRGAMDDKGPIVPALYVLAALRDTGWKLNATVKLLIANSEETDWADVRYYKERAPIPHYTIGMDGTFPVTHGQKGSGSITFRARTGSPTSTTSEWKVRGFSGGSWPTIIPERAEALLVPNSQPATALLRLNEELRLWTAAHPKARMRVEAEGERLRVIAEGKAGHAAIPEGGHNALGDLTAFLASLDLEMDKWGAFAKFLGTAVGTETDGASLGIAHRDPVMGALTLNLGAVTVIEGVPTAYLNPRIPQGITGAQIESQVLKSVAAFNERTGAEISAAVRVFVEPHLAPEEGHLVSSLLHAWHEVTGQPKRPHVTGGVLQSREFPGGVDFGPALSALEDRSHAKDEYMTLQELRLVGELTLTALLYLLQSRM